MRTILALLVSVGLCGQAWAQTVQFDGEPIVADCGSIVGKWHNPWDVTVNLTILDKACNFTIAIRHPILHALTGPDRGSGTGYITQGMLVVPLTHRGKVIAHFLLKRQSRDIGGRALYMGNYPIVLNSVAVFPVEL